MFAHSMDFTEPNMRLTQSAQHILGCVVFVKPHPQEVLADISEGLVMEYAMFKQN